VRGMAVSAHSRLRADLQRGETAGQTKWGAACGCVVMAFIFLVLIAFSLIR
jgi:hypothetical protein